MRLFFRGLTYFLVIAHVSSALAQSEGERDLTDVTLERVNQFKINNRHDSALVELIHLNKILKATGRESGYVYIDIGNIYFQLRLDEMAKRFYQKAEQLFHQSDDKIGLGIALENYGSIQSRKNPKHDSVRIYYEQALQLQRAAEDPIYAAHSQQALALYHSNIQNHSRAHQLIRQAIQAIPKNLDQHPRYRWDVQFIPQQIYLTASEIYRNEKRRPDSAEFFLQEAIRMSKVYGIDPHRVRYLSFLGTFYLEQKQWPKALSAIQHSLALADSIGYVWGKVGALQVLRNYYHQTKDAKKEAEAGYDYLRYKDEMYNNRNNDELMIISNLILQYENELEIERQQNLVKEKEERIQLQQQQNLMLIGVLILILVAMGVVIWLYRSVKSKNDIIAQYSIELETSNETMRTLLSIISHDVRSPFNSLLGLTRIMTMDENMSSAERKQMISMMHETSSKGLILLDNLLQWVALQRDKTLIKKEEIDIRQLIDETIQDLSSVALTQQVSIQTSVPEFMLESDRQTLKTIIRNMLTNAIKYSQGKQVFLNVKSENEKTIITVVDQGPGIPEEILKNLFSDGDMKKVMAKGGGLGMQIVKQLVTDLGGTITAQNLSQGGAQFEVTLQR